MKDKEPSSILIFGLLTVVSGEGFGSFHAFLQSLKVKITFDMVSVKQVVYFIYISISSISASFHLLILPLKSSSTR
ncbi:hypothetical protein [Methanolobus vulcani]|uniref:hypothetical protein n=1 Tax=Methanolobus vulcani TaxID=38026 RepID=UPI001EE4BA5B|nr:hypothetical protein [Methanolobus vulcani]